MVIEESDFKLTSIDNSSPLFDLELLYTVNKGKANERNEFKNEAYGISLESALKRIISYRLNLKYDVLTLREYLANYKEELEKLKDICK